MDIPLEQGQQSGPVEARCVRYHNFNSIHPFKIQFNVLILLFQKSLRFKNFIIRKNEKYLSWVWKIEYCICSIMTPACKTFTPFFTILYCGVVYNAELLISSDLANTSRFVFHLNFHAAYSRCANSWKLYSKNNLFQNFEGSSQKRIKRINLMLW